MRRNSVRVKLTVWHLLAYAATVVALSAYLYGVVGGFYRDSIARELIHKASLVRQLCEVPLLQADQMTLQRVVAQAAQAGGVRITVVAPDGMVLADSHEDPASMGNHASRPEIREALLGGQGSAVRRSNTLGTELLYVAMPVTSAGGVAGVVRVSTEMAGVRALEGSLVGRAAGGVLAVLVVATVVLWWKGSSLSRRLGELIQACDDVRKGNLQRRVRVRGSDELSDLGDALDAMVGTIREKVELLEQTRERLQAVMGNTPNGVVMLDSGFRIVMVNRAASQMLGISEEQVKGLTFHEGIRNWEIWRTVERAARGLEKAKGRVDLFYPNQLSVELTVLPFGEKPQGYLIIMHDVTESARAERMKTDFVANVSHELKTPVTSIKGFAETLLSGAFGPDKAREFAQVIYSEAERLAKIIDDLLELSKLESGAVRVRPGEIDVSSLIESVRRVIMPLIARAGLNLETRVSAGEGTQSGTLRSDADLIRGILLNLLDNAVKYTERGGTVRIEAEIGASEARFSVCDTGIGIPRDELPRIFERFYRVDKARSRELGGTGLGLSIAKHQAELLGGRIDVQSELGKGSRFTLVIPIEHPLNES